MAARHKAKVITGDGPRTCFEARLQRKGKKDLIARFGGIVLKRDKRAVITDPAPVPVHPPRKELIDRLRRRWCELCDHGATVTVHHVAKLAQLRTAKAGPASDVAGLCRQVAEVPGTDLARLLATLTPGPEAAEQAYQELTARVRAAAAAPPAAPSHHLASWDPVVAAILAARGGDTQAAAALDSELARYHDSPDWAALAGVLARIRDGDTSPGLLQGLDEIDTAIAARALDALAGNTAIPPELWPAIPARPLIRDLVAAATADAAAADRARQALTDLAADPGTGPLVAVLARILGGDHDPALPAQLTDPAEKAVAATILHHIPPGASHDQ